MNQYQIAVIVGSLRKESINRKLANAVIKLGPADFSFTELPIGDLPLYNQDNDGNQADTVKRFKQAIRVCQGVLFVTPEYNRAMPGVLKNAIDNASRPYDDSAFAGIPAGVMGASIGAIGTALAQRNLRSTLAYLDMPTLGQPEVYLRITDGFFNDTGGFASADTQKLMQSWMDAYVAWIKQQSA